MTSVRDNWPYQRVVPTDDGAVIDILRAIETQLDRLDVEIDDVKQQRRIDTATDRELTKLAGEVGVVRQRGESDERLRFRTQIAKAVTQSNGNIYEVGELLNALFGIDAQRFTLTAETDTPVVNISIPSDVIDAIPLTITELEAELGEIVPAGDDILITTTDTFAFDGETSGKGFNEGEWR